MFLMISNKSQKKNINRRLKVHLPAVKTLLTENQKGASNVQSLRVLN